MSVLSELCLPLVKLDGTFIAMKAASAQDEMDTGKKAVFTLGGEIEEIHPFTLPEENSERNIITVKKVKKTPKKYPRKPGTPNKQPIE